ncbi:hypothetical protein LV78_006307 [Actinosynnema pretiosum]|nr:hypothetical protein [Actinosynnema pretiosum]
MRQSKAVGASTGILRRTDRSPAPAPLRTSAQPAQPTRPTHPLKSSITDHTPARQHTRTPCNRYRRPQGDKSPVERSVQRGVNGPFNRPTTPLHHCTTAPLHHCTTAPPHPIGGHARLNGPFNRPRSVTPAQPPQSRSHTTARRRPYLVERTVQPATLHNFSPTTSATQPHSHTATQPHSHTATQPHRSGHTWLNGPFNWPPYITPAQPPHPRSHATAAHTWPSPDEWTVQPAVPHHSRPTPSSVRPHHHQQVGQGGRTDRSTGFVTRPKTEVPAQWLILPVCRFAALPRHQPPEISRRSPVTVHDRGPQTFGLRQPPAASRQPPVASRQSPVASRQSPVDRPIPVERSVQPSGR